MTEAAGAGMLDHCGELVPQRTLVPGITVAVEIQSDADANG